MTDQDIEKVRESLEAAKYAARNCMPGAGYKTIIELIDFALGYIPSSRSIDTGAPTLWPLDAVQPPNEKENS